MSTDDKFPDTAHRDNEDDFNNVFKKSRDSWTFGSEGTKENYLMNRVNPSKGKKLCGDAIKQTMADKSYKDLISQALTYKKRLKYNDMGSKISVPRAIAGEDQYFVSVNNAQRPTVKIAINMCVSASCTDNMLMMIAKSAIPTVYALETAGICTEIWLCTFSSRMFLNTEFEHLIYQVKIKSAQERFNWTTFAPVFTSGAYRHGFFLSWLRQPYRIDCGYGIPMYEDVMEKHDNYGYTAIIGNNTPGPVELVKQVFAKLK